MIFKTLFCIGILGCIACLVHVTTRLHNLFQKCPYLSFSELYERKGLRGFFEVIDMCCPWHIAVMGGISGLLAIIGLCGFSTALDPFGGFFYTLFHPK
jgi:hypothetical protein